MPVKDSSLGPVTLPLPHPLCPPPASPLQQESLPLEHSSQDRPGHHAREAVGGKVVPRDLDHGRGTFPRRFPCSRVAHRLVVGGDGKEGVVLLHVPDAGHGLPSGALGGKRGGRRRRRRRRWWPSGPGGAGRPPGPRPGRPRHPPSEEREKKKEKGKSFKSPFLDLDQRGEPWVGAATGQAILPGLPLSPLLPVGAHGQEGFILPMKYPVGRGEAGFWPLSDAEVQPAAEQVHVGAGESLDLEGGREREVIGFPAPKKVFFTCMVSADVFPLSRHAAASHQTSTGDSTRKTSFPLSVPPDCTTDSVAAPKREKNILGSWVWRGNQLWSYLLWRRCLELVERTGSGGTGSFDGLLGLRRRPRLDHTSRFRQSIPPPGRNLCTRNRSLNSLCPPSPWWPRP